MKEINPFIVHASLDVVEDVMWTTNQLYLKVVDNYYGYMISSMVTAGNIRFLLLHKPGAASSLSSGISGASISSESSISGSPSSGSGVGAGSGHNTGASSLIGSGSSNSSSSYYSHNEEPIRQFFFDVYDLYVKTLLSPFYFVNQPITSPVFDQKVRVLAKKYL